MLWILLVACGRDLAPVDLTERLGPGEVRAGVITDEAALFGGISAEGAPGDVLMYNDRVRYVIQSPRAGNYYVGEGGGVIDADVVRPEGHPGRDGIDEWMGMYGLARLVDPLAVVVRDSGAFGPARVVVEGGEAALGLIAGAVESPDLVPDLGLDIRVEYVLEPDSWLLQVRSTITATDGDVTIQPGDIAMGAAELLDGFEPGVGYRLPSSGARDWTGYVGRDGDVAYLLGSGPDDPFLPGVGDLLTAEADLVAGLAGALTIADGESATYVRWYGVGHDLATLTDAWLARGEGAPVSVDGVVTAPDGPVAGARVTITADGLPYTVAFTDAAGAFAATTPPGTVAGARAEGRGRALFLDLPAGVAFHAPYAAATVTAAQMRTLTDGAPPLTQAVGRGVATEADPLTLGEPAELVVAVADGLPFEVRLYPADGRVEPDGRLFQHSGASGATAIGWARDGEVRMVVEPGTYEAWVHRGLRFERHVETLTLVAGEAARLDAALPQAYEHPGWILGDPHAHASPSGDGGIPMEERLIVSAGVGIQLHFGSDHDHVADYTPLLAPLGLQGVLGSVVCDEVSPTMRGHVNAYPLTVLPDLPNHGALAWWDAVPASTDAFYADMRARFGDDVILQSNHPDSNNGLAGNASWTPGRIGDPDRWTEDFDAMEVLNSGEINHAEVYLDLVPRGVLAAAIGVSDSHAHTSGRVGYSATFIAIGSDDPADYTPEALRAAVRARRTVATRGPYLELSIPPGSEVVGPQTLTVTAKGPTWMALDHVVLLRDGVEVERVDGATATFSLAPDRDAAYNVVVTGDRSMGRVVSDTPWAMASAILVDVAGDGWQAPKPPLTLAP